MKLEILIALADVVLSGLTYFAGVIRTERRFKKQDRREQINSVVSSYLELRKGGKDSGWSGALRAGFATLESDEDIREAAKIIQGHGETSPISTKVCLEDVDLKVLFEYVAKSKLGFRNNPLEKLIEQANA